MQKMPSRWIKRHHLEAAFKDLVISGSHLDALGPALNSGGPIFIYGKPGNGKTAISERLAKIFNQGIFVPYSIQVDGQVIQFFDEKVHRPVPDHLIPADHPVKKDPRLIDPRWVFVYRPFIIVGGELTLAMLDLIYQNGQHCYEAPFQLKANCGVLLVDDFGRQIVKPKDFLNRWIFPLEKGIDFLTLITGKKVEVPFDQMLIFSTNLNPEDLADEAFWRRIRYKISIPNPSEEEFQRIFEGVCQKERLECSSATFQAMLEKHYRKAGRQIRAVHARDIVGQIKDQISYNGLPLQVTEKLMDSACSLYFESRAIAS
jgi:predicted ATPase with chaperone activity